MRSSPSFRSLLPASSIPTRARVSPWVILVQLTSTLAVEDGLLKSLIKEDLRPYVCKCINVCMCPLLVWNREGERCSRSGRSIGSAATSMWWWCRRRLEQAFQHSLPAAQKEVILLFFPLSWLSTLHFLINFWRDQEPARKRVASSAEGSPTYLFLRSCLIWDEPVRTIERERAWEGKTRY